MEENAEASPEIESGEQPGNAPEPFERLGVGDSSYETLYTAKFKGRMPYAAPDPRVLRAVIPGVIRKIHVKAADRVKRGDPLLVLEAMKMENDLCALHDGVVKVVPVTLGQMVAKGQVLLEFQ